MPSRCSVRVVAVTGMVLALLACDSGLGPLSELEVFVSTTPDFALLGDTVELVGVAHNGSDVMIEASAGCGPGIGFIVADSVGTETDLYAGLAWTCPLRDSNQIEPGETDVVSWSWSPPAAGLYRVRSVVRVRNGPTVSSSPAELRVIER